LLGRHFTAPQYQAFPDGNDEESQTAELSQSWRMAGDGTDLHSGCQLRYRVYLNNLPGLEKEASQNR